MVFLKIGKKKIKIDAKECRGLGKIIGLMFSKQNKAQAKIFRFNKPTTMSVHSFFCPKFVAVWLRKGQIIDYEIVDKTRFSIKPASVFDTLIEIPINKKYGKILKFFKSS